MTGRPGVRAVVFDLYITLTDFDAERRRPTLAAELADALGADHLSFTELLRATFTARATGEMGDVTATLTALARQLGLVPDSDTIDRAVALRRSHELLVTQPRAGSLDVLSGLRGMGVRVGLLSDCTPELVDLWNDLPYAQLLDAYVFSCEVGLRKPAPALYHLVADRLQVDPCDCLYVGDGSSHELTGAAAVGMTPVLLRTPFGADYRYDAEAWDGASIEQLDDVLGLVAVACPE